MDKSSTSARRRTAPVAAPITEANMSPDPLLAAAPAGDGVDIHAEALDSRAAFSAIRAAGREVREGSPSRGQTRELPIAATRPGEAAPQPPQEDPRAAVARAEQSAAKQSQFMMAAADLMREAGEAALLRQTVERQAAMLRRADATFQAWAPILQWVSTVYAPWAAANKDAPQPPPLPTLG